MPMPTWDQFMVPVLEVLADGETRRLRDLYGLVADHVGLTAAEREEVISSGMLRHHDRIGWAASDLARGKAVERPSRGVTKSPMSAGHCCVSIRRGSRRRSYALFLHTRSLWLPLRRPSLRSTRPWRTCSPGSVRRSKLVRRST